MSWLSRIIWLLILFTPWASSGAAAQGAPQPVFLLRERQMREKARTEVLPQYPLAARKDRVRGLVVAEVEFDVKGVVTKVDIVESSHPAFISATTKALRQWKFAPVVTLKQESGGGKGKLTFYFYYKNGRGWVEHPMIFQKNQSQARH
jgi:TonB family protein